MSFVKVIVMMDDMVALLGKEQADDDNKRELCQLQLDKAEDDIKVLDTTVSDLKKSIAEGKDNIATLTDEIASLTGGLKQLDKDVAEQMDMRKEEHEDYVSAMDACDLILFAKNRMQQPQDVQGSPKA